MQGPRVFGSMLIAVLLLAGCGDDGVAVTMNAPTSVATTVAVTTTAAPTTTVDAVAARLAVASAVAAEYSGEWNNTTFGSSGPISVSISLTGTVVSLVVDLGGNVFGVGDPEPFTVEFDLAVEGPYAGENELLGRFTLGTDANGLLVLSVAAVPGVGGLPMTMAALGTGVEGGFVGEYTIVGLAAGTFVLQRA